MGQQQPDGEAAPHGAVAPAEPPDDALLLDALLQYEQQQEAAAVMAEPHALMSQAAHSCKPAGPLQQHSQPQPLQQRQPLRHLFLSTPPAQPPPPPPPRQLEMWEKFL
jgi:hypothetical protein